MTAAAPKPPRSTRNKGGRPGIPFTGTDSDKVRLLARAGTKYEVIALLMGCCEKTLRNRFPDELAEAKEAGAALIGATLFEKAIGGDLGAIVWWEKTRCGMRDISRHEHTGADGAPIELKNLGALSDDELDTLQRAATILAGSSVPGAGDQSEADPR